MKLINSQINQMQTREWNWWILSSQYKWLQQIEIRVQNKNRSNFFLLKSSFSKIPIDVCLRLIIIQSLFEFRLRWSAARQNNAKINISLFCHSFFNLSLSFLLLQICKLNVVKTNRVLKRKKKKVKVNMSNYLCLIHWNDAAKYNKKKTGTH